MKKIYIVMAVLATAALASCQQEKSFNDEQLGDNSVVFTISGGATRAADATPEVRQGVVIPLETEDGSKFFLEETVVNLNEIGPETKGTPAYTENVGKLYANDLSVYAAEGKFGTATYENMEATMYARKEASEGKGWRYQHNYNGDPWPTDGSAVGFYLNMPASPAGITGNIGRANRQFTFSYTSPTSTESKDAEAQEDILFAFRSMTKADHRGYLPNGAPVLFQHALSGVKFAIDNEAKDKIAITKIQVNNVINSGRCVVTPTTEDGKYVDIQDNYSSSSKNGETKVVDWTPGTSTANFSQTFKGTVTYEQGKGKKFQNNGEYPESFAAAGNKQNLNDKDASQTFWFIPQVVSEDITLTITYTVNNVEQKPWTIDFGKFLAAKSVEWKAGELRTYIIKVDDVNVTITDNVNISGGVSDGYTGSVKTDVVISNTGNTDAYIRAALVGQWLDDKENPVFGFTDAVFTLHEVDSWYKDQFINTTHKQGTFVGLVGYDGTTSQYWVKGADGYYYYKYPVPADTGTIPGDYIDPDTGDTETATTQIKAKQPLFSSYTIGEAPIVKIADQIQPIHFELEIATQAISAKENDRTYLTMQQAWTKALGYDPTTTNPIAE